MVAVHDNRWMAETVVTNSRAFLLPQTPRNLEELSFADGRTLEND
jgi:hypothetical protein